MKKNTVYKINKNIFLIERYFKDKQQFGYIELFEDGRIEISVRKNADAWLKVLGLHHELAHLSEFLTEEILEKKLKEEQRIEKHEDVADLCCNIVAWVINHLDWYLEGVEQLKNSNKHLTKKNNVL